MQQKTKKYDFVEIRFTGYANNEMFDSNVEENMKKLNPEAKAEKTIVVIGEGMVVRGLDAALENKELNKKYDVFLSPKEAFGERRKELIKIIPLKAFSEQNVNPRAGMVFALDNSLVKILAVSGARVTVDFNNPLAGKNIRYEFEIARRVEDEKERIETLLKLYFRIVPEFEIKENLVVVKGPKNFELFVNIYKQRFKEILGKDLAFEEKKKHNDKELSVNET